MNETTQKTVQSTEESERHNINKIAEKPVDQHSGKKTWLLKSEWERERRELGEICKAVEETGVESKISGEKPWDQ